MANQLAGRGQRAPQRSRARLEAQSTANFKRSKNRTIGALRVTPKIIKIMPKHRKSDLLATQNPTFLKPNWLLLVELGNAPTGMLQRDSSDWKAPTGKLNPKP